MSFSLAVRVRKKLGEAGVQCSRIKYLGSEGAIERTFGFLEVKHAITHY